MDEPFESGTHNPVASTIRRAGWSIAALLVLQSVTHAGVYKWVDDEGNIHFGDRKPNSTDAEQVKLKEINTYTSVTYDTSAFDSGKKVIMYSAEWCGVCKRAKRYFRKHNIAFTEYDVDKNVRAKQRYRKLGATGVPVILYGRKRMNGFSEAGFRRIYE